jgi:hypothetical protein
MNGVCFQNGRDISSIDLVSVWSVQTLCLLLLLNCNGVVLLRCTVVIALPRFCTFVITLESCTVC